VTKPINQTDLWVWVLATAGHSETHQSKTYTANDRLSINTGMRCKDNKFNHGEINCNPNNIPDSNQLPA
jgi:hypothetical protein